MLRLSGLEKDHQINATVYAKIEYTNPFGSIKDRAAFRIIEEAESSGKLNHSKTIIEATSGNIGIALAGISQQSGYKCKIVMPENMSEKRKTLIKEYGAKLILTPSEFGVLGSIEKVIEIINTNKDYFYTDQFNNFASVNAHRLYTAPEIYSQSTENIDVIIAGIGTGATLCGISQFFKRIKPTTKIIGILPSNYPHNIQGIGAGFKPKFLSYCKIDKIIYVDDDEAIKEKEKIFASDGLYVGISSGAVIAGLKKYISKNKDYKQCIALVFPDGGERYE